MRECGQFTIRPLCLFFGMVMVANYLSLVTTTRKTITMQNRDMNLPASTIEKVQALLARNQKINAVKLVHDTARCSLKEAKDYVDGLEEGARFTAGQEVPNAGNIDAQLKALLDRGDKLGAIKMYKTYSGEGLAESKEYVDRLEQQAAPLRPTAVKPLTAQSKRTSTPIDQALRQQAGAERSGAGPVRIISMVLLLVIVAVLAWFLMRK